MKKDGKEDEIIQKRNGIYTLEEIVKKMIHKEKEVGLCIDSEM